MLFEFIGRPVSPRAVCAGVSYCARRTAWCVEDCLRVGEDVSLNAAQATCNLISFYAGPMFVDAPQHMLFVLGRSSPIIASELTTWGRRMRFDVMSGEARKVGCYMERRMERLRLSLCQSTDGHELFILLRATEWTLIRSASLRTCRILKDAGSTTAPERQSQPSTSLSEWKTCEVRGCFLQVEVVMWDKHARRCALIVGPEKCTHCSALPNDRSMLGTCHGSAVSRREQGIACKSGSSHQFTSMRACATELAETSLAQSLHDCHETA